MVAHPLYGDMILEAIYSGYKDVGGVKVPSRIVQRQGGFPILDVPLSEAQPGSAAAAALTAPRAGGRPGQGRGQAQGQGGARTGSSAGTGAGRPPRHELAPGFWAIGGAGGAESFVIDFRDFAVVVEAAGNPGQCRVW